jgi:hypothetical protein
VEGKFVSGAQPPLASASLRPLVEAIAASAEAERRHHRTRKRKRGDRSRSFFDDHDRFALAAMVAIRFADDNSPISFGKRRSAWASARHAAALFAPGQGQQVSFAHRRVEGALMARPAFNAPARHETAARRLATKDRKLEGLAAEWVAVSGALLARLNSPGSSASRACARALLGRLGWDRVPPMVWARVGKLLAPNEVNGLVDLFVSA